MGKKKSFVMYKSWGAAIKNMDDAQAGVLLKAIYAYQTEGEADVESDAVSFVFELIKDKFDEDDQKYAKECERKAENGKKGGLAKASKNKQNLASASKCQQELAEAGKSWQNLHDTDTESDTDTDALFSESSNACAREAAPTSPFTLNEAEEAELIRDIGKEHAMVYKKKVRDYYSQEGRSMKGSYCETIRKWYVEDSAKGKLKAKNKAPESWQKVGRSNAVSKYDALIANIEKG
jgi:hypothetical protein